MGDTEKLENLKKWKLKVLAFNKRKKNDKVKETTKKSFFYLITNEKVYDIFRPIDFDENIVWIPSLVHFSRVNRSDYRRSMIRLYWVV